MLPAGSTEYSDNESGQVECAERFGELRLAHGVPTPHVDWVHLLRQLQTVFRIREDEQITKVGFYTLDFSTEPCKAHRVPLGNGQA